MSLPAERHFALIDLLRQEGILSVHDLCARLRFSEATVRRDLRQLERSGQILRVRGGAMYNDGTRSEPPFAVRRYENRRSKQRIAMAAAEFVRDGDTLFLDSSSTTAELIPYLGSRANITVVTCGMYAATMLSEQSRCRLILSGGAFNIYTGC
ncbi:MAG TPA: DeoR/GlpR family DNA-binding transcription regulator, partial [Clostridia bacterium]|nr:DeoR/GlpR family DNA-binding transcription regulator [Clostridia bacterium]